MKRRWLQDRLKHEGFDPEWYLSRYADVAQSGIDPWDHFDRFGRAEGRSPSEPVHPSEMQVDSTPRAVSIDELKVVIASGWLDPEHIRSQLGTIWLNDFEIASEYMSLNWQNAPNPHQLLSLFRYVELNPDAASPDIHPLVHLATIGVRERRPIAIRGDLPAVPRARPFVYEAVIGAPQTSSARPAEEVAKVGVVIPYFGNVSNLIETLESLENQSISSQTQIFLLVSDSRHSELEGLKERYLFESISTNQLWTSGSWISVVAARDQLENLVVVPAGVLLSRGALQAQVSKLAEAGVGAVGAQIVDGEGLIWSSGGHIYADGSLLETGVSAQAGHWNMRAVMQSDFARLECLMMRTPDWISAQGVLRAAADPLYGAASVCLGLSTRGLSTYVVPEARAVVVGSVESLARENGTGFYAGDLVVTRVDFARGLKALPVISRSHGVSSPTRVPVGGARAVVFVESWDAFGSRGDCSVVALLAAAGYWVTVGSACNPDWILPELRQELEFQGIEVAEESGVNELLSRGYADPVDLIVGVGLLSVQAARDLHARCPGRPRLLGLDPDGTLADGVTIDLTAFDLILASQASGAVVSTGRQSENVLPDSVRSIGRALAKINCRSTQTIHELSMERAFGSADVRSPGTGSTLVFGIIDWWFRVQRPQQLARSMGESGLRVFYVNPTVALSPEWRLVANDSPAPNVVSLQIQGPVSFSIYNDSMTEELRDSLAPVLLQFAEANEVVNPCVMVDHPFWRSLAFVVPGSTVVYDCMDSHRDFHAEMPAWIEDESELMRTADLVTTTSDVLMAQVKRRRPFGPIVQIHNACWSDLPSSMQETDLLESNHAAFEEREIVVGYVGALAEWFDTSLVEQVAQARPNYRFELYGRVTSEEVWRLDQLPNVTLHGEVDNALVPRLMADFTVGAIPFRLTELIRATDPVKAYEYLRVGTPVVATPMQELHRFPDSGVLSASQALEFAEAIDEAASRSKRTELVAEWREWAARNTWADRCRELMSAVTATRRTFSVIVLTYNNLDLTMRCLESIDANSPHDRIEVIVVDNASTDGTREYLTRFAEAHGYVNVVLNESNLGYAGGNNVGLKMATGEVLVLLNNDTVVSPGWLDDLGRPFCDPKVGAVGPVTNNAGNEARLEVISGAGQGLGAATQLYCATRRTTLRAVRTLGFFCVALRRTLIEQVGLLDEAYGIGMFEDDDYCRRIEAAGVTLGLTDGVFVEHVMSASFDLISADVRLTMFEENRRIYESRWGEWSPHAYRESPVVVLY